MVLLVNCTKHIRKNSTSHIKTFQTTEAVANKPACISGEDKHSTPPADPRAWQAWQGHRPTSLSQGGDARITRCDPSHQQNTGVSHRVPQTQKNKPRSAKNRRRTLSLVQGVSETSKLCGTQPLKGVRS